MYISAFNIKHFKSFEDVTIHFNEKINLFTGINNSGKSTILEAISLWQECYSKLLQKAGKSTTIYKMNDYTFGSSIGIYCSYNDIISVRSPNYEDIFYKLDKKNKIVLSAKLKHEATELCVGFEIIGAEGGNYKIKLYEYENFNYEILNNRSVIQNPESAFKALFSSPLANVAPKEERQHLLKIDFLKRSHHGHLVFRNRISNLQGRDTNLFMQFCEQISLVLLDNTGQVSFRYLSTKNELDDKALDLKILLKLGVEDYKDISLYGSGTLQIIEILLNIYEQKNELNIIMLDEPDSHIHRSLQARLLQAIQATDNTQVFITTHNESLIRDADPNWIFHLEKKSKKEYYPIQRDKSSKKGLLSSANAQVIQAIAGKWKGLDFVNALEADVIYMVEGVNDALRIQKILSLKSNVINNKYAFWIMGNVDTIFDQIEHYKNVFSEIKNEKTLWEKTILIFDKDYLTDAQREKLIYNFTKKLKLKNTYIWKSYHFESILFSNLNYLKIILERYILSIDISINISNLLNQLEKEIDDLIIQKNAIFTDASLENKVRGELLKRRKKFESLNFSAVIEEDYKLQNVIIAYLKNSNNRYDLHKIMNKDDCELVLKNVLKNYGFSFSMEDQSEGKTNFNDIFYHINLSTKYEDWNFILNI